MHTELPFEPGNFAPDRGLGVCSDRFMILLAGVCPAGEQAPIRCCMDEVQLCSMLICELPGPIGCQPARRREVCGHQKTVEEGHGIDPVCILTDAR